MEPPIHELNRRSTELLFASSFKRMLCSTKQLDGLKLLFSTRDSVQSVGAAEAVSFAIGHNPGRVATATQDTSKLALILPTSEG